MAKEKLMNVTKKDSKKEVRVTVEEIENGFLVIKNIEGKNAKGDWEYVCKKYYSKENPLEFADKPLVDAFD